MKSKYKKIFFMIVLGLCLPMCAVGIFHEDADAKQKKPDKTYDRYVKTNFAQGRVMPNKKSDVLVTFKIGRKLTCRGEKGEFTKVLYHGTACYVRTATLTEKKLATAKVFQNASPADFIRYIGPIAGRDYKRSGILASVTIAQAILESGYGQTELARKANNLFGMKKVISGNTWTGSVWGGKYYRKRTAEYKAKTNKKYYITADFRQYNSIAASIADHSAYLLHAKNKEKYRYANLTRTKSYKKQTAIIKRGGYATNKYYAKHLCQIIKRYNLTRFDKL